MAGIPEPVTDAVVHFNDFSMPSGPSPTTSVAVRVQATYCRGIHGSTFVHLEGHFFSAGKALASGR